MAIKESFRKKHGMDFWRHELGAIVLVALKNTLKRSGLGYGRLPWPIGVRPVADFMTTKALEPDGERRFLLRLNHALILMSHRCASKRSPVPGGCFQRLQRLASGASGATRQHSKLTPIART